MIALRISVLKRDFERYFFYSATRAPVDQLIKFEFVVLTRILVGLEFHLIRGPGCARFFRLLEIPADDKA